VPEWQGPIPTRNGSRAAGCQALVFDVTLIFKSGVHIKVTQRSRMADITVPSSPSALSPSTSSSSSSEWFRIMVHIIIIIIINTQQSAGFKQVGLGLGMVWHALLYWEQKNEWDW